MSNATFTAPDLTRFCGLDELGLEVTGQQITKQRAVVECRVVEPDQWCHECGCQGIARDTVTRELAHEPFGWRPTTLLVRLRRYKCSGCGRVWRQDSTTFAQPRARLSHGAVRWALEAIVCQHLTVARVAEGLAVSWHTANDAILAEGQRILIDDPTRLDGVEVLGVDEHAWLHTRRGDKYVTVVIDLTPVANGTGPARLLDMIEGRSKKVFKAWLAVRPRAWRDKITAIAMDGFTGFKTAAAEEVPDAVAVMDPFHVAKLSSLALDKCRQRVQQETCGHRGRRGDPLYQARRTLLTGAGFLTERQTTKLDTLFADTRHHEVAAVWKVYQQLITAYRHPNKTTGKHLLSRLIRNLNRSAKTLPIELRRLGRTLQRRATDILAYFDKTGTSNGPTEALNGRLEHLHGSALGFRNLTHYIARSLLETGGFKPRLHPQIR